MNELVIVGIAREALKTAIYVAGPALIVSMVVGLTISIFQVVTSLQDQTVAFVPKVLAVVLAVVLALAALYESWSIPLAVMLVVVLSFPWMVRVMVQFTTRMFTEFNTVVRQLP